MLRDLEVGDAGLNDRSQVRDIDVENPVHPGEADDDAVLDGQRTSREASPMPASHERHPFTTAQFDDLLHLGRRPRQNYRVGRGAEMNKRIRLVRQEIGRLGNQPAWRDDTSQFQKKRVVHRCEQNIMSRKSRRIN